MLSYLARGGSCGGRFANDSITDLHRFNRMHEFDGMQRGVDPAVFVSEYAVTVDGGLGNLKVITASIH